MKVVGTVIQVIAARFGITLVVERGTAMKSNPVAVLCNSDARRRQAEDVEQGDTVEMDCDAKSRKYNEKWYTDCVAMTLKVTGNVRAEGAGTPSNPPAEPPSDDDVPF